MNKILNKQLKEFFKFLESKKYIILMFILGIFILNMFIYKESFENDDSTKRKYLVVKNHLVMKKHLVMKNLLMMLCLLMKKI